MKLWACLLLSVFSAASADVPPLPYSASHSSVVPPFEPQSAFEGYLVPSGGEKATILVPLRDGLDYVGSSPGVLHALKYVKSKVLHFLPKIAVSLLGLAGVLLVGCVITTAICAFTPYCTLSVFGWGVSRERMRSLLTEDNIATTAAFVADAIKKYRDLYDGTSA